MPGNGKAGSPAPPVTLPNVPQPKTPHHLRRGAAIDELIRSLEARWRIGLKVRGAEWSPQRSSTNDLADKIYGLVKRLYFSAEPALHQAVANFNDLATQSPHGGSLDLLYQVLSSKIKKDGGDSISRTGTPMNNPPKSLKSSLLAAKKGSQSIDFIRNARHDDTESWATAVESSSPTDVDTDDEFVTPPSPSPSPSPSSRSAHRRMKASPYVSSRSTARKRPSDSSTESAKSPKLTKTLKGKQPVISTTSASLWAVGPFKKPPLDMARSFQTVASTVPSANTSFNQTAASSQETTANTVNTSFTSYDGISDVDQRPKLTRTSSTTIGSLADHESLSIVARSEDDEFELAKQREVARIFSQDQSRESNSTFGSIDEDGLLNASCMAEGEAHGQPVRSSPRNKRPANGAQAIKPLMAQSFPAPGPSVPSNGPLFRPRSSSVGATPLLPPQRAETPADSPLKQAYYIRELAEQNLFVPPLPEELSKFPYFVLFICCRLSLVHGLPLKTLMQPLDIDRVQSGSDTFWHILDARLRVGPRESTLVWTAAKKSFEGYTFKGRVNFDGRAESPSSVFKLELAPIERETSCLFQRMFGSDRFLYLSFPSFREDTPEHFNKKQMQQIEVQWKLWMLREHTFLGRKWRVFHIKPIKKVDARTDQSADKRVIMFATQGIGIKRPMLLGEMMNEFIDLAKNQGQNFCKAFSRLDLGLSKTTPTLTFKPSQIRRISDTLSDGAPEASEFNDPDPKSNWSKRSKERQVMNDGCARISVGAAVKVWELYRSITGSTEPLPSAFQGRIGGAKGMWMISSAPHNRHESHQDIWIEVTDSQLKFEPTKDDEDDNLYNPHRLTFNYLKHSFVKGSTDLHMSFIPILVDRGVDRKVLAKFMAARLGEERLQLLEMISDPVKLHNWITKQSPAAPDSGILPWQAALPQTLPEKAKLLLRTGFQPIQSPYLAISLKRFVKQRQIWREQKLRAPLGKATFFLGVADPENVLQPGEVHVQFSSPFVDEFAGHTYRNLDGLELLVARQPACRQSDIQKVRAIVHPRLSHLVDVIVFPTKGQYPLAGKLQGGDYDGDTFWTCWEPELVEPFQNAPAPVDTPDPAKYGISKDGRKLNEVMNPYDLTTANDLMKEVLEFRTLPSLLGIATTFLEKVSYQENKVSSERIDALCDVHDLLVDAEKQAYRFNDSDFAKLVQYQLKCGRPRVPAYKEAMEASAKARDMSEGDIDYLKRLKHKPENILDHLYFDVVKKHNSETRKMLKAALPKEEDDEPALRSPFLQLRDKGSHALTAELERLLQGIERIVNQWNRSLAGGKCELSSEKYNKLLESCYTHFRSLVPYGAYALDSEIAPLLHRYLGPGHPTLWEYIRASALYTAYPKKHALVWHMAGKELTMLKSGGDPNTYNVAPGIFADMKAKPNKRPRLEEEEESSDEFESAIEQIIG